MLGVHTYCSSISSKGLPCHTRAVVDCSEKLGCKQRPFNGMHIVVVIEFSVDALEIRTSWIILQLIKHLNRFRTFLNLIFVIMHGNYTSESLEF